MTKQVEQGVHCDYAASGKAPRCYEAASRRPTAMDKTTGKLLVNSVHAEPGAPTDKEISSEIGETIERLGGFLGAKEIVYSARVPKAWRSSLH